MNPLLLELLKRLGLGPAASRNLTPAGAERQEPKRPLRLGQGAEAIGPRAPWRGDPIFGIPNPRGNYSPGSFVDQEIRDEERRGLPGHTSQLPPGLVRPGANPYSSVEGLMRGDIDLDWRTGPHEDLDNLLQTLLANRGIIGWRQPIHGARLPRLAQDEPKIGPAPSPKPSKR